MAKRKRKGRKKGGRRRVGKISLGGNPILMALLGAKTGELVNGVIVNQLAKMDKPPSPWIVAGGQGVLGYLGMTMSRNPFVQGVGVSFLFMGGMSALSAAGVLKGIGRTGYKLPLKNGANGATKELPVINGRTGQANWQKVLAGVGMV